jgi:hypothetical protein
MADARINLPISPIAKITPRTWPTAFVDLDPTTTQPTAANSSLAYDAYDPANTSSFVTSPNLVYVAAFSDNNATAAMQMRVIGWNPYTQTDGSKLWIPRVLSATTPAWASTTGNIPTASLDTVTVYFPSNYTGVSQWSPIPTTWSSPITSNGFGFVGSSTAGSQIVTVQFITSTTTANVGFLWYTT